MRGVKTGCCRFQWDYDKDALISHEPLLCCLISFFKI
jgi:hypothetical protein